MANRKLILEARDLEPEWVELCDVEVKTSGEVHPLRINVHLPFEDLLSAQQILAPPKGWTYKEEGELIHWFLTEAVHDEDLEFLFGLNPSFPTLYQITVTLVLFLSNLGAEDEDEDEDGDEEDSDS